MDAVVVEEALRSVNETCTVAVLCEIYANYSENKALTAAILRLLAARSPECRAVAEVAFAALGVKEFSFCAPADASSSSPFYPSTPSSSSSSELDTKEKAHTAERKKRQAKALSKLRAKQNTFIERQAKDTKNSEGEDTSAHPSTGEKAVKEEGKEEDKDNCDNDSNVCVFCHGNEGTLYWIGYAQSSDLLCRVDEVSKDALTLSNSKEDVTLRGHGNNVLDFLGRGLRCGTYVQRCKHSAHRECFERYRAADSFRSVGAIDRETLQCICPVCLRLSNVLIPPSLPTTTICGIDSDNDDLSFFIPLCYAENREATIHPDQELFYVVCRSLAYTAASYELAARSTGPLAAYLTPERRGILAALLTKARSALPLLEDPNTNIPALVAAFVNHSAPAEATAALGGRTLFSLDTFTVFVAYMATITAKNPSRADRSFILSLLVAEMCKVRAAASPAGGAEEVTMGQVTVYCMPFLRRVMTLLVAAV